MSTYIPQGQYFNEFGSRACWLSALYLTLQSLRNHFRWNTRIFNSSQINACVVGIGVLGPRFTDSSEGQVLHKMFPPRRFEPSTSRMPGKRRTP